MFKQIGISKKIAAGVVAGLMLSSFLPVQAYSGEDAKRHAKVVLEAFWHVAEITCGCAALTGCLFLLAEPFGYGHSPAAADKFEFLMASPLVVIGLSSTLSGLKGLKNKFWNKKQEQQGLMNELKNESEYQKTFAMLSPDIQKFVNDFARWSKKEKDKIDVRSNSYRIKGKSKASGKYEDCIGMYLDSRLSQRQIGSFLKVIAYLKKKCLEEA